MVRFYVRPQDIHQKHITFDEAQSKKMRKVLRMAVGDPIEVFDGMGNTYIGELISITNKSSAAKINESDFESSPTNITLVQALPKNLKIEFILQKCTELGVDRIIFFESEYSQVNAKGIGTDKVKRWKRILAEACEQCKRNIVPELLLWTESVDKLVESLKTQSADSHFCYLDINGNSVTATKDINYQNSFIFVGPEGGFSPVERTLFDDNAFGKVKVAQHILRSETAGMAFLSQVAAMYM
jgi:16S rRNA (uracil1498-N3)-methyltransferase